MTETFQEYLSLNTDLDSQIYDVLDLLSSHHSIFKNNEILRELLQYRGSAPPYSDLINIHADISSYIVKIAPKSLNVAAERNVLALSEMIALQSSLSLLSTLMIAMSQSTIKKLASLSPTTRLATNI